MWGGFTSEKRLIGSKVLKRPKADSGAANFVEIRVFLG